MKKNMLAFFLVVIILAMVFPVGLFSQVDEEEEPVQSLTNPMAWQKLTQIVTLKTLDIREVSKGQAWQFDLRNIQQALEITKIYEKVTILYVNPEGMAYNLGTYAPTPTPGKSPGAKEKLNKRLINPQPEPPKYRTIPAIKQVPHSVAVKLPDIRWKGKSVLLFKNTKGEIKAAVELNMTLIQRITPSKLR